MSKANSSTRSEVATGASRADQASDSAAAEKPLLFEQSLAELEALVDRLEQGDLPLEESLATFERGIHLSRACQRALDAAEQRVCILTEANVGAEPVAFDATGERAGS